MRSIFLGSALVAWCAATAHAAPPVSGVPLTLQQTPFCSAYTPAGWNLQSNPQASAWTF